MNPPANASETTRNFDKKLAVKVLGVGDGGAAIAARMAAAGLEGVSFAAVSTNDRALASLNLREKRVIGLNITRGFGTGGDPQLGRAALAADLDSIRPMFSGVDLLFLVAGLGGGTAGGAAPALARAARESGALVLGLVTLPFEFEGLRRQQQAFDSLQELKAAADSVICLPNQRLFKLIENVPCQDLFKLTDEYLMDGVRGVCRLLTRNGLIQVDFADLCAVTRGTGLESCFASAEASGESRAGEIADKILSHPLLEEGLALAEARSVLVSLQGGPDLTMAEVQRVMERLNRQCGSASVTFGAAIDPSFEGRLAATVIASRGPVEETPAEREAPSHPRQAGAPVAPGTELFGTPVEPRSPSRFVPPPPELSHEQKQRIYSTQGAPGKKGFRPPRQTQLQLDIVTKSRFAKSEPTIHEGEDLDVPTYIRRGLSLN